MIILQWEMGLHKMFRHYGKDVTQQQLLSLMTEVGTEEHGHPQIQPDALLSGFILMVIPAVQPEDGTSL